MIYHFMIVIIGVSSVFGTNTPNYEKMKGSKLENYAKSLGIKRQFGTPKQWKQDIKMKLAEGPSIQAEAPSPPVRTRRRRAKRRKRASSPKPSSPKTSPPASPPASGSAAASASFTPKPATVDLQKAIDDLNHQMHQDLEDRKAAAEMQKRELKIHSAEKAGLEEKLDQSRGVAYRLEKSCGVKIRTHRSGQSQKPKPQTEYKKKVEGEVVLAKEHGYSKVKLIAKGGCGVAWSAVNRDGKPVCIKVNRNQKKKNGSERRDMLKECQHLKRWAKMQIPYVTAYHEHFGEAENLDIEMVLDLVPQSEMLEKLTRKQFTMAECMMIIKQIATAMACIHVNGWGHNDGHAKNIMISWRTRKRRKVRQAILIDWDLAKKTTKAYKSDCKMFNRFVDRVFKLCNEPVDEKFVEECLRNCNNASFGDALIFRHSEVRCWKKNELKQWVPDQEGINVSEWKPIEKQNSGNTTIVQKGNEVRLIVTVDIES